MNSTRVEVTSVLLTVEFKPIVDAYKILIDCTGRWIGRWMEFTNKEPGA